jgi:predicted RecB family nuclease
VAAGFQLGGARADGLLCPGIRTSRVETRTRQGWGKSTRFVPIRFVFTNKLSKDDKLLLALDAFTLSKSLRREISIGKIVHGDDHTMLNVKTSALTSEVRKRLESIATLLSNPAPPDLMLNPHWPECEFQSRCRQTAQEKDDLSLLSNVREGAQEIPK